MLILFRQISNACQRFIPPDLKYEEPVSHSVEEGSYFPNTGGSSSSNQGSPPSNGLEEPEPSRTPKISTSTKSSTTVTNERQPKQDLDLDESSRAYSDNEAEDESINFDEFFDLAVYKNLMGSSPQSQSLATSLLVTVFILSFFFA